MTDGDEVDEYPYGEAVSFDHDVSNADFVDPDPDYGKDLDYDDGPDDPVAEPVRIEHDEDCHPGSYCVECGGCDCGAVPEGCTGPGCMTREDYEQWCDENGASVEDRTW